ncbi:MAG: ATP-binding cassette domain-containing protein [Deltaproteobacteria bacterium]|nr:ATP-binding cassette domain-containing protein [Deltaproteobacteria bacterium]
MSVLLEVRGLGVRSTERTLVEGVNVTVFGGEVTALCGPSGSGKSVTARAAMGVVDVEPGLFSGSLKFPETGNRDWFAGVAHGGQRAHARLLADTASLRGGYLSYSPQAASSALNPGRTIGRQMEMSVARRKTAPTSVTETIRGLLAEVGLPARAASALPGELSGGQCQRAALAVAMASDPRVLIADEPETGLDPVLRRQVVELLLDVGKAHGCGILLISHHEDTIDRIAEHVVRLRGPAEVAA